MRNIAFDLPSPEWSPVAIEEQGDVLCEFPIFFPDLKEILALLAF